ncbi:hypothetical protein ACIBG7_37945 [Nonomuraea sp. NPDC050328]|uniref:hypothetical protein n=1 Tax=Nonomuraea sp. NPDC050328 TaxID=3364361 RepID=UPI00379ECD05
MLPGVLPALLALFLTPAPAADPPAPAEPYESRIVTQCSDQLPWPGDVRGRVVRRVHFEGRAVELHARRFNGKEYGWARLTGSTRAGDEVYMMVYKGDQSCYTRLQRIGIDGYDAWSQMWPTSNQSSLQFQACGWFPYAGEQGTSRCTDRW